MQTTVKRRSSNFREVELVKNIPFIEYQRMLVYADLDDFTPVSVMSTLFGGISGGCVIEWMEAVEDFLVINGLAGLIIISDWQVLFKGVSPKQFIRILGQGSAGSNKVPENWHACYFEGTQKLHKMLDEHNLRGWEALQAPSVVSLEHELLRIYHSMDYKLRHPIV